MTRSLAILAVLAWWLGCQTAPTTEQKPTPSEEEIRSSELYTRLTKANEERGFDGVNDVTYSIELKTSQLLVVALWMRDTYRHPRKDPRFGWIYAESLQMMAKVFQEQNHDEVRYRQLMETGTIAFYSSQMIAWEDLARCAERTAGFVYRKNWSPTDMPGSAYSAFLKSLDREKKRELVETASFVAANRDVSEPDREACASGMEAMRKAIKAGRCRPIKKGSRLFREDLPPDTQVGCVGGEFATLIPDEEWQPRREEVRRALSQQLLESK